MLSSRFFAEGSVPHAIFKKIDVNADGTLDLNDAAALYEKNAHATCGGGAFAIGFAGSVGALELLANVLPAAASSATAVAVASEPELPLIGMLGTRRQGWRRSD